MNIFSLPVENTRNGWDNIRAIPSDSDIEIVTNFSQDVVDSTQNIAENINDIFNLHYFYLSIGRARARARQITSAPRFSLRVEVGSVDDEQRVKAYLSQQVLLYQDTAVMIHNTVSGRNYNFDAKSAAEISTGKIAPLLQISDGGLGISYLHIALSDSLITEEHLNNLYNISDINEDILQLKNESKQKRITPEERKTAQLAQKPLQEKATHIQSNIDGLLQFKDSTIERLTSRNIQSILSDIEGTTAQRLSSSQKRSYRKELIELLREHLPFQNIMTQYVCTYFLRYLNEEKALYKIKDASKMEDRKIILNRSLIERTLITSISYAECLMQLIENGCMHSERKTAYFSLRIHNIAMPAEAGESLLRATQRRLFLQSKYHLKHNKNEIKYALDSEAQFCMEMVVSNDAYYTMDANGKTKKIAKGTAVGITSFYNENRTVTLNNLEEVFKDLNSEADPENIAHHYGIRLMTKTVQLSDGCLIVYSPSDKDQGVEWYAIDRNDSPVSYPHGIEKPNYPAKVEQFRRTEYNIIIPLSTSFNPSMAKRNKEGTALLDPAYLSTIAEQKNIIYSFKNADNEMHLDLNCPQFFPCTYLEMGSGTCHNPPLALEQNEKKKIVNEIRKQILSICFSVQSVENEQDAKNELVLFDLSSYKEFVIELFAKALFELIVQEALSANFGVYFNSTIAQSTFIRFFALFYSKSGQSTYMKNVQIAVCGKSKLSHSPEVQFIIAGENIYCAQKTAEVFSYYNSESSIHLLPNINYFTRHFGGGKPSQEEEQSLSVAQYPFDLVFNAGYSTSADSANSWFLQRMEKLANTNIMEPDCGSKLENIHIRIQSKIHLSDFHEAEMLFHSVANAYRFSYLTASEIMKKTTSTYFLFGYEAYSQIVVAQVAELLRSQGHNCEYLILINGSEESIPNINLNHLKDFLDRNSSINYTFILPIGTTLQTLYSMHERAVVEVNRATSSQISISDVENASTNIVYLLVDNVGGTEGVREKYWGSKETAHSVSLTQSDSMRGQKNISASYFLMLKTKWHLADDCPDCNRLDAKNPEKILALVDNTSTLSDLIFPLLGHKPQKLNIPRENDQRLENLNGYIHYSHIHTGENHHLYHIDFFNYFIRCQEDINRWLKNCWKDLPQDAYHVIVSPLRYDNAPFLKAVIDNAFEHSIRLLHIPIHESYREDIRTKFSYISQEYKAIQETGKKFCVYYVDNTISTGSTLQRGKLLINMLLEEVRMEQQRVNIYTGIFTLINRSSFDTINTFVDEPKEKYHFYLHLDIPPFNTLADHCPTCDLCSKYELLEKRAASNILSNRYRATEQKHKKRSLDEFFAWREKTMHKKQGYFYMLGQYLYGHIHSNHDITETVLGYLRSHEGEPSLQGLHEYTKSDEATLKKTVKKMLDDRYYLRLYCTHKGSLALKSVMETLADERNPATTISAIKHSFLNLFIKKNEETSALQAEQLISYLKVISRNYIAKNYFSRQAVFEILQDLLESIPQLQNPYPAEDIMAKIWNIAHGKEKGDNTPGWGTGAITPVIVYQLYITVAKRLSDLQSAQVITKGHLKTRSDLYFQCKSMFEHAREDGYANLLNFPSEESFVETYLSHMKWAMMSTDEDGKCFLFEKMLFQDGYIQNATVTSSDQSDLDGLQNRCIQYAFLENNRILYSGVEKLHIKMMKAHEVATDGGLSLRDEISYSKQQEIISTFVSNEYKSAFAFLDNKPLAQNPNESLFRFLGIGQSDNGVKKEPEKRCKDMLHLFYQVQRLRNSTDKKRLNYEFEKHANADELNYEFEFENLCNCVKRIFRSKICYLVYRESGSYRMLISSSIPSDFMQSQLSEKELTKIAKDYNMMDEFQSSVRVDQQHFTLCTSLIRNEKGVQLQHDERFFIINQYGDVDDAKKAGTSFDIWNNYRETLFLRDKIVDCLFGQLHWLLGFKSEFRNVAPIWPDKTHNYMHISDLHLDVNDEALINTGIEDGGVIYNHLQEFRKAHHPELLFITGDIINGRHSAFGMEKNYSLAKDFLVKVASVLWCNEDEQVPQNWRKRILIIPGNHDYASMNELESRSHTEGRATHFGVPAQKQGSVFAKFAYYIHFLHELLGVEIDSLVKDNLNEIRKYKRLGLNAVMLNSSYRANALRNNRVSIDENFCERIKEEYQPSDSPETDWVILCHHSAAYEVNYSMDNYYHEMFTDFESFQMAVENFTLLITDNPTDDRSKNELRNFLNQYKDEDCPFLVDSTRYLESTKDTEDDDERVQIRMRVTQYESMSETDQKGKKRSYKKLKKIFSPSGESGLPLLSGHTHRFEPKAHEAGKFLNFTGKEREKKISDLKSYIISFADTGLCMDEYASANDVSTDECHSAK